MTRETAPATRAPHRVLATNTALNLMGQTLPLVAALFAVPILLSELGTARFGVLSLAWVVVGYFNVFDFGLGRAITRRAVVLLEVDDQTRLRAAVSTAVLAILAFTTVAAIVLAALAPAVTGVVADGSAAFREEVTTALRVLAVALPFVTVTVALQGLLQAQGRFGLLNAVRAPTGVLMFVAPVLVLPLGRNLVAVVIVLVVVRAAALVATVAVCLVTSPALRRVPAFDHAELRQLLGYGAWITISGLIAPLLLYLDRLLVAVILSTTALAYYAVPYDAVMKLLMLATSMGAVLFPAFSATPVGVSGHQRLASRALRSLILLLFPIVVLLVIFAEPLLSAWLDASFAAQSYRVLQLLAIGVFVNSLATVPYALIQARGRPDVTARLHIAELAPYVGALIALTLEGGITGAAVAWLCRVSVDFAALLWLAGRLGAVARDRVAGLLLLSSWPVALFGIAMLVPESLRLPAAAVLLVLFAPIAWKSLLDAYERIAISSHLQRRLTGVRR